MACLLLSIHELGWDNPKQLFLQISQKLMALLDFSLSDLGNPFKRF
jgi:hypothetical protein